MIRATILAISLLLLPALAAAAADLDHPFAKRSLGSAAGIPGLDRLEWGPSTLSYTQAWAAGGSQARGFLLKDLRATLAPSLHLVTRFGMAFTPGGDFVPEGRPARFTLPYAALTWRPSDSMLLRLEYSQGAAWPGTYPFGRRLDGLFITEDAAFSPWERPVDDRAPED